MIFSPIDRLSPPRIYRKAVLRAILLSLLITPLAPWGSQSGQPEPVHHKYAINNTFPTIQFISVFTKDDRVWQTWKDCTTVASHRQGLVQLAKVCWKKYFMRRVVWIGISIHFFPLKSSKQYFTVANAKVSYWSSRQAKSSCQLCHSKSSMI